ncbi:hypothetical protein BKA67DRAFT_641640 [Truncatella angustata]|uniref:Uncharacterized protein n=1 Tax=Truncatella angustata TaxID=152316 RepID=A0A9P8UYX8_9PEZI|nr:uncharacterized protein BKA67DRAFT_641640 [Truncatella angustata]KAH6660561.1 hypothetical protein BKA67DRAFT_641640 [Truncatella angustata]
MASSQESAYLQGEEMRWQDFDNEKVFEAAKETAAAATCDSFVLEFGPNSARIVQDLDNGQFQFLMKQEKRDTGFPIRWINIWNTSKHKDVVKLIGQKYAFSQRLISLMIYAAEMQQHATQARKKKGSVATKKTASKNVGRATRTQGDAEKGLTDMSSGTSPAPEPRGSLPPLEGEEIEIYLLMKDTVNYSSIDHTDKALCVGAHWLHKRPERPGQEIEVDENDFMPPKHWLWLVLCDDHTVITLHEGPVLEAVPEGWKKEEWDRAQYKSMRANSLDVLLQQSQRGMSLYEQRPLSQNSIRQALKKSLDRQSSSKPGMSRVHSDVAPIETAPNTTLEDEGTSSLFYYLFEDYSATGPLKAAGKILEELTPKVLHSAERKSRVKSREIIQPLHILSKDLRTLKHLFETYMILINKILTATKRPGPPQPDPRFSFALRSESSNLSESLIMSSDPQRKVFLTSSALQRFDRLRDRLRSIMLSTIEGHFEEINALQDTYFNLTQQKDSAATARLTRSATLLAKLSVFFLPISFITAYFSIQVEDIYTGWTAGDYYYTFAVTISVSFLSLFFFGRLLTALSDALDDWADKISDGFRKVFRVITGFKMDDDEE